MTEQHQDKKTQPRGQGHAKGRLVFLVAMLLVHAILVVFVNQAVLLDAQNSADEYAFLLSARIFASGKLSVPSQPLRDDYRDFFLLVQVIDDGKFYGKTPPGWPFFLMFGVLGGMPMLVNLLFALAGLGIVYKLGADFFSDTTARVAALIMATNPFAIMYAASYYSQTCAMFFAALGAYCYLKTLKTEKSLLAPLLLGLALGMLSDIRPFDAAIAGAWITGHFGWTVWSKHAFHAQTGKTIAAAAIPGLLVVSLMLAYNYCQTGHPFLMPSIKYDPNDHPSFALGPQFFGAVSWALHHNIVLRLLNLNFWMPFYILFMLGAFWTPLRHHLQFRFLLCFFLAFVAGYFFYMLPLWNSFGPRYLYPSAFALFLVIAAVIAAWHARPWRFRAALYGFVALNLLSLVFHAAVWHERTLNKIEIYRQVEAARISNAIVFIRPANDRPANDPFCSGDAPCYDLTRNGMDLNGSVLYAIDQGWRDIQLMEAFPHRTYYLWSCDAIETSYSELLDILFTKNHGCSLSKIAR